jgi:hypothetical protein
MDIRGQTARADVGHAYRGIEPVMGGVHMAKKV